MKYLEQFKKGQMDAGILLKKHELVAFNKFGLYLDYHLMHWLKQDFGEALLLSKIFRDLSLTKQFQPMSVGRNIVLGITNQMRLKSILKRFTIKIIICKNLQTRSIIKN